MVDADRQTLLSFLTNTADNQYSPQSGEITGILKQINEDMTKTLAESTADEKASIASFEELVAAKKKEVAAATKAIETKTSRVGELGVSIVQMKNELSDSEDGLAEDKKFMADMDKNCAQKKAEWDEIVQMRSQEQVALAETIKVLNDDDSLELFKKTLPTPAASFVQVEEKAAVVRTRAAAALKAALSDKSSRPGFDFILLALRGKKNGFDKVIKMIDTMVGTLKEEQQHDEHKKEHCNGQFDTADDKKKALERAASDADAAIAEAEEGLATSTSEIEALTVSIKALDKSVADATSQRKDENADFKELIASNSAAKQVLGIAKNRLQKFYNPKLYSPAAKRDLSEEERITVNMGGTLAPTSPPGGIAGTGVTAFVQISEHDQKDAPAPPPKSFGAYKKSDSSGVLAMIDLLVQDLDKEMTIAKTDEDNAQEEYEQTLKDSAEKRTTDTKALAQKESTKADLEEDLAAHKEAHKDAVGELMATKQYINSLHGECDWLIKYFDARKEARNNEIDALGNAKAILSGADFSFLETQARSLRGGQ